VRRHPRNRRAVAPREQDAAPALRYHDPRRVLRPMESPVEVDAEDAVKVGERRVEDAPEGSVEDPRIVVHDVKPAMLGHGGVHEVAHVCLDGNVAAGIGCPLAQLRGQGLARLVLDVGDYDPRAVLVEEARCARTYPARAASDDRDLAF